MPKYIRIYYRYRRFHTLKLSISSLCKSKVRLFNEMMAVSLILCYVSTELNISSFLHTRRFMQTRPLSAVNPARHALCQFRSSNHISPRAGRVLFIFYLPKGWEVPSDRKFCLVFETVRLTKFLPRINP